MRATIDAGRLMIPKDIRARAGFRPGMSVDVRWHDGRVVIEPESATVSLVRRGRFVVAVPLREGPVLTTTEVEATREAIASAECRALR